MRTLFNATNADAAKYYLDIAKAINSSATLNVLQRSKPDDSWSPVAGQEVITQGARWGIYKDTYPNGDKVAVWSDSNSPAGTESDVVDAGAGDDWIQDATNFVAACAVATRAGGQFDGDYFFVRPARAVGACSRSRHKRSTMEAGVTCKAPPSCNKVTTVGTRTPPSSMEIKVRSTSASNARVPCDIPRYGFVIHKRASAKVRQQRVKMKINTRYKAPRRAAKAIASTHCHSPINHFEGKCK